MADISDLRLIPQPLSGQLAKILIDFVLETREELNDDLEPALPYAALSALYQAIGYLQLESESE